MSVRLGVFASGNGTNLQALIDRFAVDDAADIVLVMSDRANAGALERAAQAGIRTAHVPVSGRSDASVVGQTMSVLGGHDVELIALAGYLRLVPAEIIAAFPNRILNIHPALLPAFGGPGMYSHHVHEAVLRARCRVTGATVHEVNEEFDAGRIVAQWPVPVLPGDDAESLGARVLSIEHKLYPAAVSAVARRLRGQRPPQEATGDVFRLTTSHDGIDSEIAANAALENR